MKGILNPPQRSRGKDHGAFGSCQCLVKNIHHKRIEKGWLSFYVLNKKTLQKCHLTETLGEGTGKNTKEAARRGDRQVSSKNVVSLLDLIVFVWFIAFLVYLFVVLGVELVAANYARKFSARKAPQFIGFLNGAVCYALFTF
jgi:hypothetical protein